jgi:methyl-accepting chemotaxis protein
MNGLSIRLTHKIMAIGLVGLIGLLTFGGIYQAGTWSQDASRSVANNARAISDLNKQLSIEMLEARRNEKNFQQRRNETYAKAHAELTVTIDRDFDRLQALMQSDAMNALREKVRLARDAFMTYGADFSTLVSAEVKLGLNETLGLSGSLRAAVHDIESRLKEIDDPRLTSWMLMMRSRGIRQSADVGRGCSERRRRDQLETGKISEGVRGLVGCRPANGKS